MKFFHFDHDAPAGEQACGLRVGSLLSALAFLLGLASAPDAQGREDVLAVLEVRQGAERGPTSISRELASLKPDPIPVLFDVYERGVEAIFSGEPIDLSKYCCAPDEFPALALEALGRCDPEQVIDYVESRASESPQLGQRLGLMRLLGTLKSKRGLKPLVRLMDGISRDELASISIQFTFEEALASILKHDDSAARVLKQLSEKQSMERMPMFVQGALKADHPRSLEYLSSQVGRSEELDGELLLTLGKLQERFPWQRASGLEGLLSSGLRSKDSALQAKAVWIVGRTYKIEHAQVLIELLNHKSSRLRNTSLVALVRLSAGRYQSAQAPWAEWLEQEAAWWQEEAPDLLTSLLPANDPEADQAAATDALRKLARHPFYAQRISARIASLLPNMDPILAAQGIQLLEVLGSQMALPALIGELASGDHSLRSAAHGALQKLTGERLGPRREDWAEFARL